MINLRIKHSWHQGEGRAFSKDRGERSHPVLHRAPEGSQRDQQDEGGEANKLFFLEKKMEHRSTLIKFAEITNFVRGWSAGPEVIRVFMKICPLHELILIPQQRLGRLHYPCFMFL